ncbi:UNVERIFIED_CONTAM: protein -I, chloroplastic [Sesamum latifolium]|uniref:Protein TIC 20 n=1 Tax=Sesamum latifolium TaxID=2727402 RepID=A0AAW2X8V2_9LAMI
MMAFSFSRNLLLVFGDSTMSTLSGDSSSCSMSYFCIQHFRLSAASTPLLHGEQGGLLHTIPKLPRLRQLPLPPRESKDVPYSFRLPAMTEEPSWWWRILAFLPYLMPLCETCTHAQTAYHLHPFLEDFEFLTYRLLGALGIWRLPSWCLMAYPLVAYLVIGTVSRWMPLGLYWGKIGMHTWTAIAFAYLFTVLECMRCALAGMYADVPFVSDAAYIQIPYETEGSVDCRD